MAYPIESHLIKRGVEILLIIHFSLMTQTNK